MLNLWKRLKNLWELSKLKPVVNMKDEVVTLERDKGTEGKPKGMAKILGDSPVTFFTDEISQ